MDSLANQKPAISATDKLLDLGLIVVLIAINLICFGRTLTGYFLADDYGHIAYLTKVFHGYFPLLLENFYSNWLQTEGTKFYRPLISLTLAWDYLLFGANAFGYHLSNTLFQIGCAIFLFLTVRRLTVDYGQRQARWAAFFTAALFSAHPLHPEVVSWVIGRVDSVCTLFYLLSFWLFLKGKQENCLWAQAASVTSFVLCLLSKEMAISLPPTIMFYCFAVSFSPPLAGRANLYIKTFFSNFAKQFMAAFKQTWPFWLVLTIYLIGRTLALGTISGGYSGSVGEGLNASLYHRLFTDGSLSRVLFPFDLDSFSTALYRNLRWLYIISTIAVVVRVFIWGKGSGITRLVLFAMVWFLFCMLPTYQVWGLTEHLQGSRFIYMGTAPLCLLLTSLLLPLSANDFAAGMHRYVNLRFFRVIGCLLLSLFVIVFMMICTRNNSTWAKAGNEVRSLRQAIESKCLTLAPDQFLVVMNLPQRMGGAHELYNAAMLNVLLQPPLTGKNLANRVVTFEPATYGDSELLNLSRLRRLTSQGPKYQFTYWDREQGKLVPLDLQPVKGQLSFAFFDQNHQPLALSYSNWKEDNYLISPACDLSTATVDYVDVTLSVLPETSTALSVPYLYLSWNTPQEPIFLADRRLALPIIADGKAHAYRFYVGQHKNWLMAGTINQLRLDIPFAATKVDFYGLSCSSGEKQIPNLSFDANVMHENVDGITYMNGHKATFTFDASQIPQAKSVLLEVSNPNSWFEHYTGDFRDMSPSAHCLTKYKIDSLKGSLNVEAKLFPYPAYYQVRLAALSSDGKVVGTFSDPVNLQIAQGQIDQSKAGAGK